MIDIRWNQIELINTYFQILIENKTAIGIEMIKNGRKMIVTANKEVVLSAGAVNSPQLLMLSGIGPKEHLEELKVNKKKLG